MQASMQYCTLQYSNTKLLFCEILAFDLTTRKVTVKSFSYVSLLEILSHHTAQDLLFELISTYDHMDFVVINELDSVIETYSVKKIHCRALKYDLPLLGEKVIVMTPLIEKGQHL